MINLRYHVVSITAVFLALGIGIAMGSSFLGSAAVDRVDENIRDVRREAAAARAERDLQRTEVQRFEDLETEMLEEGPPTQFTNDLADVPVVLLTVGGVDDDSLDAARVALESSQAQFEGVLRVDDKVVDDGSREELATVIDAGDARGDELTSDLADAVAAELTEHGVVAGDPPPEDPGTTTQPGEGETTVPADPGATTLPGDPGATTVPEDPAATTAPEDPGAPTLPEDPATSEPTEPEVAEPTVLRDLVAAGFLAWEPTDGGPEVGELLAGTGYRYVVVTGAVPEVPDEGFLLPVIEAMAVDGPAPLVLASAATGDDPEVREANRDRALRVIRGDDVLRDRVSTVDDLEVFAGVAAVVGAVDDLAGTDRGHYGVGEGRDSLLPPA